MLRVMKTPVRPTPALQPHRKRPRSDPSPAALTVQGLLSSCNSPAVNSDRPVLAELLLGFVYLSDEIDEALPRFGHTLLRPVGELELAHRSRLTVLQVEGRKCKDGRGDRLENTIKRRSSCDIDCLGNILLFLSNDCCHLILDQWPCLTWSCNVSVSVIVSRSPGNYIFASLHSLSVSLLMEINSASVGAASGQA